MLVNATRVDGLMAVMSSCSRTGIIINLCRNGLQQTAAFMTAGSLLFALALVEETNIVRSLSPTTVPFS